MISTAVIFLLAGYVIGRGGLGLIEINTDSQLVTGFVQLALFSVLFTDGMEIGLQDLIQVSQLPGRALLLGLPITLAIMAFVAHLFLSITWAEAFLIGAVLSPTDPVFASALVSRPEVPLRLRRLLNVESGVNDGIALPIVLTLLAVLGATQLDITGWLIEIALGIALGIVVPWVVIKLEQLPNLEAEGVYEPLEGFTVGILVYSLSQLVHANLFLAAFVSGVMVATLRPKARDSFLTLGSSVAELLKLASLLMFGGIISLEFLFGVGVKEVIFAIVVLLAARPLAFALALFKSPLSWRERLAAAWFGPRGFASVVYGLLVFSANLSRSNYLFKVIAIVIVGSMIAHSSTDVIIARWFKKTAEKEEKEGDGGGSTEGNHADAGVDGKGGVDRGEETRQDVEKV